LLSRCLTAALSIRSLQVALPNSHQFRVARGRTVGQVHESLGPVFTCAQHEGDLGSQGTVSEFSRIKGHGSRPAALWLESVTSRRDRKSTRMNSSHVKTPYTVICL